MKNVKRTWCLGILGAALLVAFICEPSHANVIAQGTPRKIACKSITTGLVVSYGGDCDPGLDHCIPNDCP
ncbi:hypothetical protein KXD93_25655 [Mucilaginibacter sp. BJC16-A38]|uniref:hypothetical protein n=1 Tax=Mucilaginibacter phenanthrenivorans TaxID=1234842 RepID=UPI0021580593|nr:hypothetical protein [Mucilaginibacter phenanthrenivorans]MCR8561069.1 hypothetical protein [Mucilaginibacter phenanthrenivorans]